MDEPHLYKKISDRIRQEILKGQWKAGERLPSVREMAAQWNCTVGTIQHAYQELVQQGLVTSRAGQGTRVAESLPALNDTPMRRAQLIHRAESFLLESLNQGYHMEEVNQAVREAMERWQQVEQQEFTASEQVLRFAGSHDLVITWLASHFDEISPGASLQPSYSGSMRGLIALEEGQTDLAGCHLLDEETGQYNLPFVRRLLPGKRTALIRLANRRLGLILPPGNPLGIRSLADLTRPGVRLVNRQPGSGTRVWLDLMLKSMGLDPARIEGFTSEKLTHFAVAQAVAEGQANAGIGLEGAAQSYGLDFEFLTHECYDLAAPEEVMDRQPVKALLKWLNSAPARQIIEGFGGYDTAATGRVEWTG